MPAKGFLNQEQKERLQTVVRKAGCPQLREHALILLLQNDGETYEETADFIGRGYHTVAYWCMHRDPDNLESLRDKREQGNYRKATEEYIALLQEVIEKASIEFRCEFGKWTTQRLATYLLEQMGIKLSGKQVSRTLQKKVRLHLGKIQLRSEQNVAERVEFREKLKTYLKVGKVAPEVLQTWFWDETGFSLRVIWCKC